MKEAGGLLIKDLSPVGLKIGKNGRFGASKVEKTVLQQNKPSYTTALAVVGLKNQPTTTIN